MSGARQKKSADLLPSTLWRKSKATLYRILLLVVVVIGLVGALVTIHDSRAAESTETGDTQVALEILAGDCDGNGVVNGLDLSKVLTNYGRNVVGRNVGDLDANGIVNALDLSQVLTNYGHTTVITGDVLSVNATNIVRPFDRKMKGIALANWMFTKNWGKPYVGDIQGLPQAVSAIDPGIVRYAGGLWANSVGFDRNRTQVTAYTAWQYGGKTYYFNYGTDELASVDKFAKSVNAEVMLQVNISNDDPAMWADLVRYAKEKGFTSFKYYEIGNELDLETQRNDGNKVDPQTYGARLVAYQDAMLAVDPTIQIVGGVPAEATDAMRNSWACCGNQVSQYITQSLPAARNAGKDLGAVSIHWYQTAGATTPSDVLHWSWNISNTSGDWWRNGYSRHWSGLVAPWIRTSVMANYPTVKMGVSELGVNSADDIPMNGNHIGALWYSDVLGRLAYSGVDWVTQWNSYAGSGEYFSLMYPNNDQTTAPTIELRPTYYAYLMYSKYFGDQLVQSNTYDPTKLSIWASKDTDDPDKLKLRITNLTDQAITVPVVTNNFQAASGQAYVLSSTSPTDSTTASAMSGASTSINGIKVNGMDVAGSVAAIQPVAVPADGGSFNYTIPAYSSSAVILEGTFQ